MPFEATFLVVFFLLYINMQEKEKLFHPRSEDNSIYTQNSDKICSH